MIKNVVRNERKARERKYAGRNAGATCFRSLTSVKEMNDMMSSYEVRGMKTRDWKKYEEIKGSGKELDVRLS